MLSLTDQVKTVETKMKKVEKKVEKGVEIKVQTKALVGWKRSAWFQRHAPKPYCGGSWDLVSKVVSTLVGAFSDFNISSLIYSRSY